MVREVNHRRRWHTWSLVLLIPLLVAALAPNANAIDVELRHPVYRYLDRCQLEGFFRYPLSGARPYTRHAVAERLVEIARHRGELNSVETRQLDYFLFEFEDDLPAAVRDSLAATRSHFRFEQRGEVQPFKMLNLYRNPRYIYETRGDDFLVTFNPNLEYGLENFSGDGTTGTLKRLGTGFIVMGYYKNFGLLAAARDAHLSGNTTLADPQRYPIRYSKDLRNTDGFDFDEADALISYEVPHVQVTFGKTSNQWDWGQSGQFGLSDNPTTYTQLRYRLTFEPLEVTGVHARLRQQPPYIASVDSLPDGQVRYNYAEKWMAGHHYQINMFPWMQIGLWDLLIYGNRGLEFDYLPPMAFLWSMEHYAHDQDNVLLGIDWRITPGWRTEVYGQLLMDELQFSKLGSDWWGNKHGMLLGLRQVDALGVPNSSAAVEYVYIRPFVYTHSAPYNLPQHYGVNLGYPLPPNSDVLFGTWRQTFTRGLDVWVTGRRWRHGTNPASGRDVGGDIETLRYPDEEHTAKFLDGDLHTTTEGRIGVEWEVSYQVFLSGEVIATHEKVEPEVGGTTTRDRLAILATLRWHPYRWR